MIAILVPVLGRAHQIAPLLANLEHATTTPYRVVFICSKNDDALPVCQANADTLVANWAPDRADYAKKLTLGVRCTTEPWLFQGATDLRFRRFWDSQALRIADRSGCGVIGTNDLGNKQVMRGIASTHSLISRAYLDRYGGTIDNSGAIFSERYDHQWSDVEFVQTAQKRNQFAFARRSIVEHLHPHWRKGVMDATYEKALRETKQDSRLYEQRRRKFHEFKTT